MAVRPKGRFKSRDRLVAVKFHHHISRARKPRVLARAEQLRFRALDVDLEKVDRVAARFRQHLRFSFGPSESVIERALERLQSMVDRAD